MFRQRLTEIEMEPDQFLTRVYELPVVNDAIGQLSAAYNCVKERNRLFRFTLSTAESGVHAVVSRTIPPVVAKFEKPFGTLNTIACHQLDKLEHDYPIITKPSDKVFSETKQMCSSVVKPLVNSVAAVTQFGVDKVTNAKAYTAEKMDSAKTYGLGKFHSATDVSTKQVNRVLDSSLCHEVVRNMNSVLGVADNLVDKWLPEGVDAGQPRRENAEFNVASNETLKDHVIVLGKAANIGNKVRRRMYTRIANRMTNLQLRTKETVERLNFTVDLIEFSRTSMTNVNDKAWYVWTEVNKSEEEVAKELTESIELPAQSKRYATSTFESKAIATARHLTQKLRSLMTNIGLPAERLPTIVRVQFERARDLTLSLAASIPYDLTNNHRVPTFVIDNLRNYSSLLLQTTSWMVDWTQQAPLIGRFMPRIVTEKTTAAGAESSGSSASSWREWTNASRSRHDPSAVKEPAEDDDHEHHE